MPPEATTAGRTAPSSGPGGVLGVLPAPASPGLRARVAPLLALLRRDVWVAVRYQGPTFLFQSILQPLIFVVVFAGILPASPGIDDRYATVVIPGIVGLTAVSTSLQTLSNGLLGEFASRGDITDRLLIPAPVAGIALEKVLFATLNAGIAATVVAVASSLVFPGALTLGAGGLAGMALVVAGGALVGSALGLALGTRVPLGAFTPVFGTVMPLMYFTGGTFFSWTSLDGAPVAQYVTLINPLVYVTEGARAAAGAGEHLPLPFVVAGVLTFTAAGLVLGIRGFRRKAVR